MYHLCLIFEETVFIIKYLYIRTYLKIKNTQSCQLFLMLPVYSIICNYNIRSYIMWLHFNYFILKYLEVICYCCFKNPFLLMPGNIPVIISATISYTPMVLVKYKPWHNHYTIFPRQRLTTGRLRYPIISRFKPVQ